MAATNQTKARTRRPKVHFSEAVAAELCRRLEKGESLTEICRDAAMPDRWTVTRWARTDERFRMRYETARATKAGQLYKSTYSEEIAAIVCNRLATGESLRGICQDAAMPGRSTVIFWLRRHEEFRAHYAAARELQAEHFADEIIEIADSAGRDPVAIAEAKLRIDARKWLAARLAPRKYGNVIPASGTEGSIVITVSPSDMGVL